MIDPSILIGEPLVFQGKLKIYPPRVKDVATNPNFNIYLKTLTVTQEELRDELQMDNPPTAFEFLLANCFQHEQVLQMTKQAFWLFCQMKAIFQFDKKRIVLIGADENEGKIDLDACVKIEEENFFDFQNTIRRAMGDKPLATPEPYDPDEDPRIRRIKEKARERDRIKAKQSGKSGISLSTCLTAICCMGIGLTPLNIGEMSYASVGEIMKVMQDKEKYDIDIRSLLAGADSKKVKPKYWIRNNSNE